MKIIAILPAYNEEGKVGSVVEKLGAFCSDFIDEVLVVDDASTDGTFGEAKEAGATVILHKKNMGAGPAIRTGMEYALEKGYDVCVVMGADDQDKALEIERLIKPIFKEGYDFVQGSRYLNGQRTVDMPVARAITTRLFTLFFRLASGFPATDASNGFRAYRLNILRKIDVYQEWFGKYDLEPYLYLQAIRKGFKVKEVRVTKRFDLEKGYSKMKPLIDWYTSSRPILRELLKMNK